MTQALQLADKKVTIMGLGLQGGGLGVARYFASHGAKVTVTDLKSAEQLSKSIKGLEEFKSITFRLGSHELTDFTTADIVIKGPSVRWDNQYIQAALDAGVYVAMETALFATHTKAKVIGITGTRGKSTTTMMIYQTLSALYKMGTVYLAGNVPDTCALELLDVATRDDIVVLELSSWQLSGFHMEHISPHIAVFTNFYPDHLNYYKTMSEYLHDKDAIFTYQKPGDVYIDGRELPPGSHDTQNRACARACCIAVLGEGCADDIEKQLNDFKGLPFRQQLIGTYHHVQIINDATSTTPIALITALRTFTDKPIVLIMGGQAKNLPIDELVAEIRQNTQIRQVFHMPGTFTDQVREKVGGKVYEDFTQLVQRSLQSADELHQECYLLFSPGATSFAQFKNEFDRGQAFDKAISAIIF